MITKIFMMIERISVRKNHQKIMAIIQIMVFFEMASSSVKNRKQTLRKGGPSDRPFRHISQNPIRFVEVR